jgi:hypothetical protein
MTYTRREPTVDEGTIALVAMALIAHGHSRSKEHVKIADRVLALAVERLDAAEKYVAEERARQAPDAGPDYDSPIPPVAT